MKRDDKLTNFMTYGGSYTLLDREISAQVQVSCYKQCPVSFHRAAF